MSALVRVPTSRPNSCRGLLVRRATAQRVTRRRRSAVVRIGGGVVAAEAQLGGGAQSAGVTKMGAGLRQLRGRRTRRRCGERRARGGSGLRLRGRGWWSDRRRGGWTRVRAGPRRLRGRSERRRASGGGWQSGSEAAPSEASEGVPGGGGSVLPAANGRGEWSPCADSSARHAALEAASSAAAVAASAAVFGEVNDSGGSDESAPKRRGGAIGGRGELDDAAPESGGVKLAGGAPDASMFGAAVAEVACGCGVGSRCGRGSCATIRMCGASCSGRAANSRRTISAIASAA